MSRISYSLKSVQELESATIGQFAEWLSDPVDRVILSMTKKGWKEITRHFFPKEEIDPSFKSFEKLVFTHQIKQIGSYVEILPHHVTVIEEYGSDAKCYSLAKTILLDAYEREGLENVTPRNPEGLKEVHEWAVAKLRQMAS